MIALLVTVTFTLLMAACKPPPPSFVNQVENAAAVAQYEALLDDCRRQGKATGSFDVYKTCADAVDDELCARHHLRCPEDR
jgi:D-Tyr-tRNAtyr deacylase